MIKEAHRNLPEELLWGVNRQERQVLPYPYVMVLVRHGRPTVYAETTASLHPEGVQQIQTLGDAVATDLMRDPDIEKIIDVRYSTRERTMESALVFHRTLREYMRSGVLVNTTMLPLRPEVILGPHKTLGKFVDDPTVGKEHAFDAWMSCPPDELKARRIKTTKQVAGSVITLFNRMQREARELYGSSNNRRVISVVFTHETHIAAVRRELVRDDGREKIPFGAMLQITDNGLERSFEYNGTIFTAHNGLDIND